MALGSLPQMKPGPTLAKMRKLPEFMSGERGPAGIAGDGRRHATLGHKGHTLLWRGGAGKGGSSGGAGSGAVGTEVVGGRSRLLLSKARRGTQTSQAARLPPNPTPHPTLDAGASDVDGAGGGPGGRGLAPAGRHGAVQAVVVAQVQGEQVDKEALGGPPRWQPALRGGPGGWLAHLWGSVVGGPAAAWWAGSTAAAPLRSLLTARAASQPPAPRTCCTTGPGC